MVSLSGGAAEDYKFYMFGGRIGAMYTAWRRSSGDPCYAWFADDLQTRIDDRCVVNYESSLYRDYYTGWRRPRLRHCTAEGCLGKAAWSKWPLAGPTSGHHGLARLHRKA